MPFSSTCIAFYTDTLRHILDNIYIPFLIHNLPKNYNKFNINNIIKIKTTIYINSIEFTKQQTKNYINTLNYSNINNNNIK